MHSTHTDVCIYMEEKERYSSETFTLLADLFHQVILSDIKGATCGTIKHCQINCDTLV